MFILNNTFIQASQTLIPLSGLLTNFISQGLHVLIGAKYLNTMVGPDASIACQTVSFGAIVTVVCWLSSLPRTFSMLSKLGTASAAFTFISVILATIFAGVQGRPAGFLAEPSTDPDTGASLPSGLPIVTAVPILGTTFVAGLGAFLNIRYFYLFTC